MHHAPLSFEVCTVKLPIYIFISCMSKKHLAFYYLLSTARWDQVKLEVSQNAWDCQCENEWLIHDLYPQIRQDNEKAALEMQCATPSYLKGIPFEKVYQDKNFLRCPDANGNHPENDGKLLMGLLIGLLIGIPLAMGFVLIYKRGCFGLFGSYNYEHSRALYKRASFNEDY